MRHLWEHSPPDTLVQVGVLDSPANMSERLAVVFDITYSETVTASMCVSDQGTSHALAEARITTVLPGDCVLKWIILRRIELETSCNGRAHDFLVNR